MGTTRFLGAMVALALAVAGCESDSGTKADAATSPDVPAGQDAVTGTDNPLTDTPANDPGGTADVSGVCAKIFSCLPDHWGWDTEENCRKTFLDGCKDATGYLSCVAACVAGSCDAFGACENDCWSGECE